MSDVWCASVADARDVRCRARSSRAAAGRCGAVPPRPAATPMTHAFVVVDLGFGDAGKGSIVDALVRRHDAKLVVRWNGGAQAGHTVVTDDGRTHTFSQLGAGTFVPGVRTHLTEDVVVHPTALVVEAKQIGR